MTEAVRNVVIIGSGPAGLTAAIYTARANLAPLCIEGFSAGGSIPGGQLMFTTEIENFPGFPEKVSGQDLMQRFRDQATSQGAEIVTADVTRVDLSKRPFRIWYGDDANNAMLAKTVIIATGARANYLGLANEAKLKNKGVSACAVCDGALYRREPVAVVGGGDTAMEDASYLAGLGCDVTLIHRRDELRASKTMQQRVLENPKITALLSHVVRDVLDVAQDRVTAVQVEDLKTKQRRTVPVSALFVAIGHTPMSDLFAGQIDLDPSGYVKTTPGRTETSVPGVFACGDIQDSVYQQAITAAATGCMAAIESERFLVAQGEH
jgi:thioredoxin reductase (NADPH)